MWEKNKKLKTITGKQPKQRVRIRFIGCRLRLYCWIWFSQAKRNLPLHVASSTGNLPMVKFLLSQDSIHVDEEDCEGMTPILRYLKRDLSVLNKTRERKRHVLLVFWVVSSCDTESCLILRPTCSVVELCAYKNELIWFEGASIENRHHVVTLLPALHDAVTILLYKCTFCPILILDLLSDIINK